jgi:GntR family transcriptional regulator, transcriptional repressor for pyruvate dehydrogenase complex
MTFQPVHPHAYARVRLSDVVSGQIRQLISDGTLLPGQRLPAERDLAEQLNVSRPSLREALIRLESDGFIRAAGRGGFVVSDVTAPLVSHPLAALLEQQPNASADVLELRHGLETLSTAYAAERANADDLARIGEAFAALQAAVREKSTRIAEKDAAFHLAIADATHNVALTHVMHGLNELLRESITTMPSKPVCLRSIARSTRPSSPAMHRAPAMPPAPISSTCRPCIANVRSNSHASAPPRRL